MELMILSGLMITYNAQLWAQLIMTDPQQPYIFLDLKF